MNRRNKLFTTIAALALLGAAPLALAESGTVKILAPWNSEGKVFPIGPEKLMFQGSAEGIMYIDGGEGSLDATEVLCPGSTVIDLASSKSKASGNCIIMGDTEEDVIFAEYTCEGGLGSCDGDFKINGGTGRFEGITGSGKMAVRTALAGLAADLDSGQITREAAGLAVWPELKYSIPEKK